MARGLEGSPKSHPPTSMNSSGTQRQPSLQPPLKPFLGSAIVCELIVHVVLCRGTSRGDGDVSESGVLFLGRLPVTVLDLEEMFRSV